MTVGILMTGIGILIAYSVFILKEIEILKSEVLIEILKVPEIQKELLANLILSYTASGLFIIFQLFQMMKDWEFKAAIQKARDI